MISDAQYLLELLEQVLETGYEREDEVREAMRIAYLLALTLEAWIEDLKS